MPKVARYSWDAVHGYYKKQLKLPDKTVKTLYAKTEEEMDQKLAELKEQIAAGVSLETCPTVGVLAKKWFERHKVGKSASRIEDYRLAINAYIGPALATKLAKDVTLADGQAILDAMADKSDSLQAKVGYVLKSIFEEAEEDHLIVRSPVRKIKVKGKRAEEKVPLTDAQVDVLLDAVRGLPVEPFVRLALYAGLRKEEILGLRWQNVHLDPPAYIDVRERVTFDRCQPIHEPELKSKASRRRIAIPDPLVDCLARLDQTGSDFVIHNRKGGPLSAQSYRRLWEQVTNREIPEGGQAGQMIKNHKIAQTLDFHCTAHQLRHTYITNLCRKGLDIKTIQYLAGHANVQITLDIYAHAVGTTPEDLSASINDIFA